MNYWRQLFLFCAVPMIGTVLAADFQSLETTSRGMPEFASDVAADAWLRTHSASYRRMAEFVDQRWGCSFGTNTQSAGGFAYVRDGRGHIDLHESLRGSKRVSIQIFEMTNLYQQDRHEAVTTPVRRGEQKDATQFAMMREAIEYDGLRLHREVLQELERVVGELPSPMITLASSTATNLAGYALPMAYDYFQAQAASGHTDHYRRLFEKHAAEARASK